MGFAVKPTDYPDCPGRATSTYLRIMADFGFKGRARGRLMGHGLALGFDCAFALPFGATAIGTAVGAVSSTVSNQALERQPT